MRKVESGCDEVVKAEKTDTQHSSIVDTCYRPAQSNAIRPVYKKRWVCYICSEQAMAGTDECLSCRNRRLRRYNLSLPPEPTDALPGSEEKIEILRERMSQGYDLWHPQDAKRSKA